ncbi:hypothetical protein K488DRAFT_77018 [Vararia minispora EC-137]|uniref:Uncharacterized protein n=1 Tax=Vararia minispora EC-137 TaxID=1314806 RepID=A0ACB8QSD1_9AGAM|nr:hypothetical protein K488DRAFT_77018 [Vararia minispora EC-137]
MSSDSNLDEELLELAGETQKKRKHSRQGSSSKVKRRKADDSYSEGEGFESEEDAFQNKYPLENRYRDEEDKRRLLDMPEVEREAILAERKEEMQKMEDQRQVASLLQAQRAAAGVDSVSKAAKRQHTIRGATKEKSSKLDELKAKRKAKDERRSRSSPRRDRSSSPMEMETEDEEDGQIGREEQEEERERRLLGSFKPSLDDQPITIEDLAKVLLTRDLIARHCMAPWFEDYVKGSYVRYLIGNDHGQPIYRICEILNLATELVEPYKVNERFVDQQIDLKHGASVKSFPMDKVSNSPFTQREFDRLVRDCQVDKVKLPTRSTLEKKAVQMKKLATQVMTDSDISAMLQRKQSILGGTMSHNAFIIKKSGLQQLRNMALKRNDRKEVMTLDAEIATLGASTPKSASPAPDQDEVSARLAKVNERNRKANLAAVRKLEQAEAERKRKEREKKLTGNSLSTSVNTKGSRFVYRGSLLFAGGLMQACRTGTSLADSLTGTALNGLDVVAQTVSPLPPSNTRPKDFSARILETIDIDLGDFF